MTYDYEDDAWHQDLGFMKSVGGLAYMLKLARHALVRLAKLDDESEAIELINLANRYNYIADWLLGKNGLKHEPYYADSTKTYKLLEELKKLEIIE